MRGGSIPLLAWGTVLLAALIGNWIWTHDWIQTASFGAAVLIIYGAAMTLAIRSRRESLRRGPPRPATSAQAVPTFSLGAFLVAVAFACLMFGFVFGRFLVYFGAGLLLVSLGLVAYERRGERGAQRAWPEQEQR